MALFPAINYKGTVVAIDGKPGQLLSTTRAEHQAILSRGASDYSNYLDAAGEPIVGPVSLCDAVYVALCVADFCDPCDKICVVVPDALLVEAAGTELFVDDYVEVVPPVAPNVIPDVALAGDVKIGYVAPIEECDSPSLWDNSANLPEDQLPAGYSYLEIVPYLSNVIKAIG